MQLDYHEIVASVPDGFRWLMRSDDKQGGFANLIPVSENPTSSRTTTFPIFAPDPLAALQISIGQCRAHIERDRPIIY